MNLTHQPVRQKEPKPVKDPAHLARVKALPCVICGHPPPSDAHHCHHGRYSQRKRCDLQTIPLCKEHHQSGPEAIHNGKETWREKYGADHFYLPLVWRMLGETP